MQAFVMTLLSHALRITSWNYVSAFLSGWLTLPRDLFLDLVLLRYVPNIPLSQRPPLFPSASLQHLPHTCSKSHSSCASLHCQLFDMSGALVCFYHCLFVLYQSVPVRFCARSALRLLAVSATRGDSSRLHLLGWPHPLLNFPFACVRIPFGTEQL